MQKYEDEISKGSLAFVGASEKLKQKMVLHLGNLLPGDSCLLTLETISEIEFSGGSFMYVLPSSFAPDYKKHLHQGVSASIDEKKTAEDFKIDSSYEFRIQTESEIVYISAPENHKLSFLSKNLNEVMVKGYNVFKNFKIFFKPRESIVKRCLVQRSDEERYKGQVAIMFSSIATLEEIPPNIPF